MRQHKQSNAKTLWGGVIFWPLFLLAVTPFIFATPAHADSISISLDSTAVTLQHSGDLYKHTSSLHVHNSNTYGFTLSMSASQPNLVNSKDSTYKISSVSGTNQHLAANQWGYGMGKTPTTFSSVSSASLADITSDNKGSCSAVDDCTFYLTFGSNIDSKRLPVGNYSATLTYTAVSKPAPYVPSTPSSGGSSYDYWWSVCYDRYSSDSDKRSYCYIHDGNMSGYWNEACSKKYSGDDDKISYCKAHDDDMSGYEDYYWDKTCSRTYLGDDDKISYCRAHNGDVSGYNDYYLNKMCRDRYRGSDTDSSNKRKYCVLNNGSMSGYMDWLCNGWYRGDDDKISYCKAHDSDMSGYDDYYWRKTCDERYPDTEELLDNMYCYDHHGDMSGLDDLVRECRERYPGDDNDSHTKRMMCEVDGA